MATLLMVLLKTFWHHSREHKITANDQAFNKEMSKVRIAVEWGFGKITQYFEYLDVKKPKKNPATTSWKILHSGLCVD